MQEIASKEKKQTIKNEANDSIWSYFITEKKSNYVFRDVPVVYNISRSNSVTNKQ